MAAAEKGDYARAYQEFSELADKGDTDALVNMSILTDESCGLNKPPDLPSELICKAVAANNVHARFLAALGSMFAAPVCPKWTFAQNDFLAVTLASAAQGYVSAMLWSAKIYENGHAPDSVRAYAWYTVASKRGESEAQQEADRVAKRLSIDERARAKGLAETLDHDTPSARLLSEREPCRPK